MNRGQPYQRFDSGTALSSALRNAPPANTLVIIDSTEDSHGFTDLADFVKSGGRAILQFWGLKPGHSLATAFDATVVQTFTTPSPVYDWGGTPLFGASAVR